MEVFVLLFSLLVAAYLATERKQSLEKHEILPSILFQREHLVLSIYMK
jgi:hypothetical protein